MGKTLAETISDGKVHVFDGAMGTVLYGKGVFVNVCYDELNLKQPQLVREVHEAYLAAGADILETNTFGANPVKLGGFGLAPDTEEINATAARITKEVAGDDAHVVGAIGPLGIRIEPFGPTSREEARNFFTRQATGLLDGGVEGFIVETFHDLAEIHEAIAAVREVSSLPLFAQMTVGIDQKTGFGTDVPTIAARLTEWGADVVGVNCSVGPSVVLDAVEELAKHTDRPIAAQPNAGIPRDVGDRKIYMASPEYVATYAKFMIEKGAKFVGGCCGTTPEHIREVSNYVASTQVRHEVAHISAVDIQTVAEHEAVPLNTRSSWGAKIASRQLVTSVEIVPPKGAVASSMLAQPARTSFLNLIAVISFRGCATHST